MQLNNRLFLFCFAVVSLYWKQTPLSFAGLRMLSTGSRDNSWQQGFSSCPHTHLSWGGCLSPGALQMSFPHPVWGHLSACRVPATGSTNQRLFSSNNSDEEETEKGKKKNILVTKNYKVGSKYSNYHLKSSLNFSKPKFYWMTWSEEKLQEYVLFNSTFSHFAVI